MTTRTQLLAEAREWLRTPFLHQAASKGVGTDCVGLVRGVCAVVGICGPRLNDLPEGHLYCGYAPTPDGKSLQQACDKYMDRITLAQAQPADVFLLAWDTVPQHVGFLADYRYGGLSVIHVLGHIGRKGRVVEQRLDDALRKKFVAVYRLREFAT